MIVSRGLLVKRLKCSMGCTFLNLPMLFSILMILGLRPLNMNMPPGLILDDIKSKYSDKSITCSTTELDMTISNPEASSDCGVVTFKFFSWQ